MEEAQILFVELATQNFKCIPNEHFGEEETVSELTWTSSDVTWKVQIMDEFFRILLHVVRSYPDMVSVVPQDVLQGYSLGPQLF
jgi:hypothetical protein